MTTTLPSSSKAPYATVRPFSEILNRVRGLQLRRIDTDTLTKWGYKSFDASSVISAFKFLNVIDKGGNTTSDYLSLKSDSTYQRELRRIVESAYSRVFAIYGNDLSSVSKKEIADTIILNDVYPATAKQTAAKAAGLFVWLCNAAGIETSEEPSNPRLGGKQQPASRASVRQEVQIAKRRVEARNSETGLSNRVNLNVNIDATSSEEEIYSVLANVFSALQRHEDEHHKQ
jgi:hypothetical protein